MRGDDNAQDGAQPLLDLPRLGMAIRRRGRIWATLALLGLLIGAVLPIVVPNEPTAVASILVVRAEEQQDSGAIHTDAALLHTTRIASTAVKSMHSSLPPQRLLDDYEVTAVTDDVLRITVNAPTDREAVSRASALSEAFVADHARRAKTEATSQSDALLAQRDRVRDELKRVNDAIARNSDTSTDSQATESLYSRRSDLQSQIADLGKQANEAKVGHPETVAGTQVVDRARALPLSLPRAVATGAGVGLVAGLALGLVIAAVAGVSRQRPVLRAEIAEHLGGSVIAELHAERRGWQARSWLPWKAARHADLMRVSATLARAVRGAPAPVSLLELGCPRTCAALAWELAKRCGDAVHLVDELPGRQLQMLATGATPGVVVLDAYDDTLDEPGGQPELVIGIGTVGHGAPWTDLASLGRETVLVVRSGYADAAWLHTVARQLADLGITVIGIVLVAPDRHDHSDGTLWDSLHTALRGRAKRAAPGGSHDRPVTTHTPSGSDRRATNRPDDTDTGRNLGCAVSRAPTTGGMARG